MKKTERDFYNGCTYSIKFRINGKKYKVICKNRKEFLRLSKTYKEHIVLASYYNDCYL